MKSWSSKKGENERSSELSLSLIKAQLDTYSNIGDNQNSNA